MGGKTKNKMLLIWNEKQNKGGRSHEQNKRATKDHSRTDRDKSACQESISVLFLWPLSQTIQPARMKKKKQHLEADASGKHCDAEAGGEAAKTVESDCSLKLAVADPVVNIDKAVATHQKKTGSKGGGALAASLDKAAHYVEKKQNKKKTLADNKKTR